MTINEIQTELTNEKKKTLELSEKIKNEEDLRLKSKKAMRYKIKIVTASIIWLVAILLVTIPWIKYNILPTSSFIRFVAPIFIIIAGFFIMFGKSKVMKIVSLVIGIAGFVKLLNELWRIIKNVK
jgi:hypothetical protein